jgi:hypothetical protein
VMSFSSRFCQSRLQNQFPASISLIVGDISLRDTPSEQSGRERRRWSSWIFVQSGSQLLRWCQGVSALLLQSSVSLLLTSVLTRFRIPCLFVTNCVLML